jgi:hypothetical protein
MDDSNPLQAGSLAPSAAGDETRMGKSNFQGATPHNGELAQTKGSVKDVQGTWCYRAKFWGAAC